MEFTKQKCASGVFDREDPNVRSHSLIKVAASFYAV